MPFYTKIQGIQNLKNEMKIVVHKNNILIVPKMHIGKILSHCSILYL